MRYIIFPDIHGRDFWKDCVEAYKEFDDITYIFLGDYLDPYPYEKISMQKAIDNFKDILKFQIESKNTVYLLLGNHDLHYIFDEMEKGSRYEYFRADEIKSLFENSMKGNNILQMDHTVQIDGNIFYFSHAGVSNIWIEQNKEKLYADYQLDRNPDPGKNGWKDLPSFNWLLDSFIMKSKFASALSDVSFYRWGPKQAGSMVWADWQEFLDENTEIPGMIQIFGHTQQEFKPVNIDNKFYCLDVRRAFILNENGKLTELDGSEIQLLDKDNFVDEQEKALKKLSTFIF